MKTKFLLLIILFFGLLLRLVFLMTPTVDSDQSVFGLMAMHILRGEFPIIQWGFPYMATGESFFAVPFFLIFGATPFSLDLSVAIQSLIFVAIAFFLGRRIMGERMGLLAALYVSICSSYLAIHCVLARGAYIETLILGSIALWMAVKIFYPENDGEGNRWDYGLLGLALGLGLWFHFLVVFFILPIGIFFLLKPKTLFKKNFVFTILSFFVGSLPFWIHNFTHRFESFAYILKNQEIHHTFFEGIVQCLTHEMPIVLGIFSDHVQKTYSPLSVFMLALYGLLGLYLLLTWIWTLKSKKSLKGLNLVMTFFVTYFFILARSHFIETDTRRYFIPIFSGLSILWAYAMIRILKKNRFVGALIVCVFFVFHSFTIYREAMAFHPLELQKYRDQRKEEADLLSFLKQKNLDRVHYTNYWLGFRLNFIFQEAVVFAQTLYERYEPYFQALEESDDPVFLDVSDLVIPETLKVIGGSCKSHYIGAYKVFYDFEEPQRQYVEINPEEIKAKSSHESAGIINAIDRRSETLWSSWEPKARRMSVEFDLGKEYGLGMIRLWNKPQHSQNYSMNVTIEVSQDGKVWTSVVPSYPIDYYYWNGPRLFYWDAAYRWEVRFGPVNARFLRILQQEGESQNPWMMNEVFIYRDTGENIDPNKGKDDLLRTIMDLKLERVYADRWLNAQIKRFTKGTTRTFEPLFDSLLYNSTRRIEWGPKIGFVLDRSDVESFEKWVKGLKVQLIKKSFGKWDLFYFEKWTQREEALKEDPGWWWIGFGVVKANNKIRSEYLRRYANQRESSGDHEEAVALYQEALKDYPNNQIARRELIALLEKMGLQKEADQQNEFFSYQTKPQFEYKVKFDRGVEFLGFRMDSKSIKAGQKTKVIYYWRLNKDPGRGIGVFVHFEGNGKLFQGDHRFLEQHAGGVWPALEGEIFREESVINIPKDIFPGRYRIGIGLFDLRTGKRLKVRETDLEQKDSKVFAGELEINS